MVKYGVLSTMNKEVFGSWLWKQVFEKPLLMGTARNFPLDVVRIKPFF